MINHLAIPCKDISEACEFYKNLGASVGRRYPTHAVLKFFNLQLVVHLSGQWDREARMYPRHFGIILRDRVQLMILWDRWKFAKFVFEELFERHKGKSEEHAAFFLKDPSNNVIEFKFYKNLTSVFG